MSNLTPLMKQYVDIKQNYPDTLIFFQVGDFYELFYKDAETASSFLGIQLTRRGLDPKGTPIPLCGVPIHAYHHYLTKLVRGGFKVAVCDQLEIPKPGKIVDRGITQVLTPGTLTDFELLDDKSPSYLCFIEPDQTSLHLLFLELLTGQLFYTETNPDSLESEINRFQPDEIVTTETKLARNLQESGFKNISTPSLAQSEQTWFAEKFPEHNQKLEIPGFVNLINLAHSYLQRNNKAALEYIKQLSIYKSEDYLAIDSATQKHLELVKNNQDNTSSRTLFSILDHASTSMGSRMLKKWILRPLAEQAKIDQRFDAVQFLLNNLIIKEKLKSLLSQLPDIERIVGRIALKRSHPGDYIALAKAISLAPEITEILSSSENQLLQKLSVGISNFSQLQELLENSLNCDKSIQSIIKIGYNQELDKLKKLTENSSQQILDLEHREQIATGISSLKIRFNGAYGYGIEVTKPNLQFVPAHYTRTQTLVNRDRFTIPELKEIEYDLQRAQTDIIEIEKQLFENIKQEVYAYVPQLRKLAANSAYVDAIYSLAQTAYSNNYTRPEFNQERKIEIVEGKHPVISARLGNQYIPNSVNLSDSQTIWIITGPNMGGKSTFLRQTALTCIMAQIGSFVPAQSANLFVLDRIFTRIGASDNVSEDKSTFLVEMEETALICNQATANSLIILDEIGRGTSTFDGLAIAQAVIEFIFSKLKSRCLFATHYHELTELSKNFAEIVCYHAASEKTNSGIILLHKILPGAADGSFGIEVAKMAKLPQEIIIRANKIHEQLSL